MILFEELAIEHARPKRFSPDGSENPGVWKAPLDLVRGDEVLTVSGWQTVTEKAWQIYEGEQASLKVIGRNKLWLDLPIFRLISNGAPLAYTKALGRNPDRVASVEDVSVTLYLPLEEISIGHRVEPEPGWWVALSGTEVPRDRSGRIKLKRVRFYAEGEPRLRGGFKPETVEFSDGTVMVKAQSVLTRSILSKIERGELNYGH